MQDFLVLFGIYAQIVGMYAAATNNNQFKLKGYHGLQLSREKKFTQPLK